MTEKRPRSLVANVRTGAIWNVATTLILRVSNILVTAVTARILAPRDFGVFAVALTAFAIVSAVGELGVASCLIRADLDIGSLAPTMATVSLGTSAVMAGVMALFAGPIATALGSSYAAGPVRVMALAVLLTGVFAVPSAQLVREFKQNKLFLANAISFFPSTIALIVLAKTGDGAMAFAWSRVIGQLAVGCVIIASVNRHYLPGLARPAIMLLVQFGLPLAGANFVNFILLNVDYALVGRLMGTIALGTYVLAFNVSSWPSSLLGTMINNVAMPAFSRVRHDARLMQEAIADGLRAIILVVMPMCALIMALARPLILTLYGSKWSHSAAVLSALTLYAAVSIVCLLFSNILSSMGRTKLLFIIQVIWLGTLAPAMAIGVHEDGIVGAAYAHITVIIPLVLPCYLIAMKRTAGVRIGAIVMAVFPALAAAGVAGLAARIAADLTHGAAMELVVGLLAGGLSYSILAVPQAIPLLNRTQVARLRTTRVGHFYILVARFLGLRVKGRSRHAGARKAGGPKHSRVLSVRPADYGREDRPSPNLAKPLSARASE